MTRVAFLSPLPPETSGIADYSAELLPALAEHLELEVFTAQPDKAPAGLGAPVFGYADFPGRDAATPYDSVLYQLGNSAAHHGPIYRQLLARPGIVVLHEFMLHNLVRDLAATGGGRSEFVEVMRYCCGKRGQAMAGSLLHANNLPESWHFPLFEQVVDAAQGLIVHSRATRDRVLLSRPTARVAVVPHHLSLHGFAAPDSEHRRRLLAPLGAADSPFVVASFGHLTASKHLDVSLRAFAELRRQHPEAVYLLVGEVSSGYAQLTDMLAGELGSGVLATGRVVLDDLLGFMTHADVAINLRRPTGGETSGACLRLLGLGRPIVVSNVGWFAEIPDHCCAKVAPGPSEEAEVAASLAALAGDPALRQAMGSNAAAWAAANHQLADAAQGYADWVAATLNAAPTPYRPAPPLAPAASGDTGAALIAELAAGLGDLGITEEDSAAHRVIAETLVDLDLDRAGGETP